MYVFAYIRTWSVHRQTNNYNYSSNERVPLVPVIVATRYLNARDVFKYYYDNALWYVRKSYIQCYETRRGNEENGGGTRVTAVGRNDEKAVFDRGAD